MILSFPFLTEKIDFIIAGNKNGIVIQNPNIIPSIPLTLSQIEISFIGRYLARIKRCFIRH
jgi:hypothetical protein